MRISENLARLYAADHHGGQASALYSFASTGKYHFPLARYVSEIEGCHPGEDTPELFCLLRYLREMHPLPDGGGLLLDTLTKRNTGFGTFAELVFAAGRFRPSFSRISTTDDPCQAWELGLLADAYDLAQARRGDPRRAWRGCQPD